MDDAFFDGEAEHSDWLELIDEAVSEAMEQFDIDSLAPTGTPKDWVGVLRMCDELCLCNSGFGRINKKCASISYSS